MSQPPRIVEVSHRYPGITQIAATLSASNSRRVLDLGTASAASFNFFMRKGCTVRFENVSQYVADRMAATENCDQQAIRGFLEEYLSGFRSHDKFDVVLAWDLFSFLDLETAGWLMAKLGEFCQDQSFLHSVRYFKRAPSVPAQFQVVNDHEVKTKVVGEYLKDYQPHELTELIHALPYYHLESSFVKEPGMLPDSCEEIYCFMPTKRNIRRQKAKLAQPEVSVEELPGVEHHSYALDSMCDYLSTLESPQILDLGAPVASNEDFYANFSDRVVFAELYEHIQRGIPPEEIANNHRLIPCEPDEKFDVVFAWALLGMCSKEQLRAFKERLLPHMHGRTKIHVVIYAGNTQPSTPDRYLIKNTNTIYLPEIQQQNDDHPPMTAIQLLKALGDASYENSFIMKPGMAPNFFEHILILQRPELSSRKH